MEVREEKMSINSVVARNEFITSASRNEKKNDFYANYSAEQGPVANKAI
jgi:hypothetical protein